MQIRAEGVMVVTPPIWHVTIPQHPIINRLRFVLLIRKACVRAILKGRKTPNGADIDQAVNFGN